ncbi:MAG: hydantoinase B/oxoprolinase family protein [Actinobacteria bacterium]|nr:hydantoinase B/oxoprolinase family protein [Actinomycetota bacterium]
MNEWNAASLQVAWQRLISIADEMAAGLLHSAFSAVVRESNDLACALLSPRGDLLVEYSRSVPVFTGILSRAARSMIETVGAETLRPGDVLAMNDPWHGNTHLADLTVVTPIFHRGELIAYAASICHLSDIGGASEGAFAYDVYEEGLAIPPLKLISEGKTDDLLMRLIERNVRLPQMVIGDIHALVAANEIGARRLTDLLDESAGFDLAGVTERIGAVSEDAMRRAIAEVPDGRYVGMTRIDGFEEPKEIHVAIEVSGDRMRVDFAGTSVQSERGINSASTSGAYTLYSLKCLLTPDIPNNAWTYGPIDVVIPPGSLLNPSPPAAVSANFPAHTIQGALYDALREAMPEAVMAPSGAPFWVLAMRGNNAEGSFGGMVAFNGGQGALREHPGCSCLSMPSNVSNTPIEVTEAELPLIYERKAVARGSGGEGSWPGGDGQEVVMRSLHDEAITVTCLTERIENPAAGISGGGPGTPGTLLLDGDPVAEPKGRFKLGPGGKITLRTPGGGGYGPVR